MPCDCGEGLKVMQMLAEKLGRLRQSTLCEVAHHQGVAAGVRKLLEQSKRDETRKAAVQAFRKEASVMCAQAETQAQRQAGAIQGYDAVLGMLQALATGEADQVHGGGFRRKEEKPE